MTPRQLFILLVLGLAPAVVWGQPAASDLLKTDTPAMETKAGKSGTLILAYIRDAYPAGVHGWTGSATWLFAPFANWTAHTSLGHRSVPEAHWTTGTLGAVARPTPRTALHAKGKIGPGTFKGDDFTYFQLQGGAIQQLHTSRFFGKVEAQHFDVAHIQGALVGVGLSYASVQPLSGEVSFAEAISGNLNARFVLARLDLKLQRLAFFAAAATGRGGDVIFNGFPALGDTDAPFKNIAGGIAREQSGYRLLLTLEVFKRDQFTRWSYGMVLQSPLPY